MLRSQDLQVVKNVVGDGNEVDVGQALHVEVMGGKMW